MTSNHSTIHTTISLIASPKSSREIHFNALKSRAIFRVQWMQRLFKLRVVRFHFRFVDVGCAVTVAWWTVVKLKEDQSGSTSWQTPWKGDLTGPDYGWGGYKPLPAPASVRDRGRKGVLVFHCCYPISCNHSVPHRFVLRSLSSAAEGCRRKPR